MSSATVRLLAILTAMAGCGGPTEENLRLQSTDPDRSSDVAELEELQQPALRHTSSVSSALVASTCTEDQRQAAIWGQDILLTALVDATNAYSANTDNPLAMEVFGARDEEQRLTVFVNLLWAYQTLMEDGKSFNIEYSCNAPQMCRDPEAVAWAETPYFVAVCDPNDSFFWDAVPYVMAHEIWHWLGWGDPQWVGSGDTADDVHFYAQNEVAIAIQMPHAYALYLYEFIKPLVN